jgi:hypothetical protein
MAAPTIGAHRLLKFASVIVSVRGTPPAVLVELPKLLRMLRRTTPLAVSTFEAMPLTVLEPSEG